MVVVGDDKHGDNKWQEMGSIVSIYSAKSLVLVASSGTRIMEIGRYAKCQLVGGVWSMEH